VDVKEVKDEAVYTPLRSPVLKVSVAEVLLPTLTNWGLPVRKSRIQLQREVFIPGENDCPPSLKPRKIKADCGAAGLVSRKQDPPL
jgi:hypothetical protein